MPDIDTFLISHERKMIARARVALFSFMLPPNYSATHYELIFKQCQRYFHRIGTKWARRRSAATTQNENTTYDQPFPLHSRHSSASLHATRTHSPTIRSRVTTMRAACLKCSRRAPRLHDTRHLSAHEYGGFQRIQQRSSHSGSNFSMPARLRFLRSSAWYRQPPLHQQGRSRFRASRRAFSPAVNRRVIR